MNLILERTARVPYFTDMRLVLAALGISATAFDWYLSDLEINLCIEEFPSGDRWISGEDLQCILERNEIQFIWAVFSACPKGSRWEVSDGPYADGNRDYWTELEVKPQLPGALFEIACWDSSATILVGLPPEAEASFQIAFPEAKPLASPARRGAG